jgi:hypothetical protein
MAVPPGGAPPPRGATLPGSIKEMLFGLPWAAISFTAVILLASVLLWNGLSSAGNTEFLNVLKDVETSRALIAYLLCATIVGLAIINIMGAFLLSGEKDVLAIRLQHAKDTLSMLLAIFGTLVGFYFGVAKAPLDQAHAAEQATASRQTTGQTGTGQANLPAGGNPATDAAQPAAPAK